MTIGEKIKKLRKEHDITQEKLAEYLNITYQAVSKCFSLMHIVIMRKKFRKLRN